ncbi:MAG: OmpH family outer membrane protein [Bacteroidota bacterium]
MKKIILFCWLAGAIGMLSAQKVGYIDSEKIMAKIPEYQSSQQEIERVSEKWQKQLEEKYAAIEQLYQNYTAQEVLLPEDIKKEKQEEIFKAEREAKEFRESKFGYNGALFLLQESKVKPIQDKLMRAVAVVAKKKRYAFVFDKAGEVTWMYTDGGYDISDDVLEEMGYKEEAGSTGGK